MEMTGCYNVPEWLIFDKTLNYPDTQTVLCSRTKRTILLPDITCLKLSYSYGMLPTTKSYNYGGNNCNFIKIQYWRYRSTSRMECTYSIFDDLRLSKYFAGLRWSMMRSYCVHVHLLWWKSIWTTSCNRHKQQHGLKVWWRRSNFVHVRLQWRKICQSKRNSRRASCSTTMTSMYWTVENTIPLHITTIQSQ